MSFLDTIWGDAAGVRCVVSGKMRHEFYADNRVKIPTGKNVWFAPALFASNERKAAQAISAKAVWLDIDCGKPTAYATQTEAVIALKTFLDDVGLPMPTIVNSGNGLHCYFMFEDHLPAQSWLRLAKALKEACADNNLLADSVVTTDIARLLRVPGTLNYKDPANPKTVDIMMQGDTTTHADMESVLADYIFRSEVKSNAKKSNAVFNVGFPITPKSADAIAGMCAQLRELRDTRGNVPEPHWYAGLGIISLCTDAERIAQEWSDGHPNYSYEATAAKLERSKEFAPTTCARFEAVNPSGCVGCEFAGTITSPIQLGEDQSVLVLPQADPAEIALPRGYIRKGSWILRRVVENEGDDPIDHVVFTQPVWVSSVAVGETGGASEVEISWVNSHGVIKCASCPQETVASDTDFAKWLRRQNINGLGNIKIIAMYIAAAITMVDLTQKEQIVYSRFGRNASGFLVGNTLITEHGTETARVSRHILPRRLNLMQPIGTLEAWVDATRLLNQPKWWAHRFTVLSALSAPLFSMTGNQGSVLSLAGDSSTGKTIAANLGVSAFGSHEALTTEPQSTINAFYENWRQVNNLPLVINEAATIPPERLSKIIYAAANGIARDGLKQDSSFRDAGTWATITICTSNLHLRHMPDTVIKEAERNRILELTFDKADKIDLDTGNKIADIIRANHGVAGRTLIAYLMKHVTPIVESVAAKVKEIQALSGCDRFGLWQIASNAVIGKIASDIGIIAFEYEDAITRAIDVLKSQAPVETTAIDIVTDIIAEWTTMYQQGIGTKETSGSDAWHYEPRGEARGRWNAAHGKKFELCVPSKSFKAFAIQNGADAHHIKQWADSAHVTQGLVRLSPQSRAIWCYIIPQQDEEES